MFLQAADSQKRWRTLFLNELSFPLTVSTVLGRRMVFLVLYSV